MATGGAGNSQVDDLLGRVLRAQPTMLRMHDGGLTDALPQQQSRPPPSPSNTLSRSHSSTALGLERTASSRLRARPASSGALRTGSGGMAAPVHLSVLGTSGVQQSVELTMEQLGTLGEKTREQGILLLDNQLPPIGDAMSGCFEHLNAVALSEALIEENKKLRSALQRTRSLPAKPLKGGQFRSTETASGRRTMRIPRTQAAMERAPAHTLWQDLPSEEATAHDRMINLGRAWSADSEALSLLLGEAKDLVHRDASEGAWKNIRGDGGLREEAMEKRLLELESLLAALRRELALRNKECVNLRMKNSMLQMTIDSLRKKVKELEDAISSLRAQMAALQAQLDAQRDELARLREFHDRHVAAAASRVDVGCDAVVGTVTRGNAPVWNDYAELLRLKQKLMQLEEQLRQLGDVDLLRQRLKEEREKNARLTGTVESLTDERDSILTGLQKAESTIVRRDMRIIELEEELRALDEMWSQRLANAVDDVNLCVIAPRMQISFEGGSKVSGVPTIPRDQLQRMLDDDLLPRFARIFSNRTTECEEETQLLKMQSPETQSPWLRDRLDALKTSVTEQIEALFGEPAGLDVVGQRRAAAAVARSAR